MMLARGALLLLPLSLSWPAELRPHTHLRSSTPAAGTELAAVPNEVRLTFSEPITLSLTRIELLGPDGAVVALLAPEQPADSPQVVLARITGELRAGEYQVSWQTAGRDGHPVRGGFGFAIAANALGLDDDAGGALAARSQERSTPASPSVSPFTSASPPTNASPGASAFDADGVGGFGVGSPLYALVRLLAFIGVLGVVGVMSFRLLVLQRMVRVGRVSTRLLMESIGMTPARLGVGFAGLLALTLPLRLAAQGYALGGGGFDGAGLRAMLLGTMWGWGWIVQAVAVLVAGLGFHWASRGRAGGWGVAGGGVLLLALTLGFAGHAAGVPTGISLAILADAGHVLGAGGWLGSLLLMLGIGLPSALRLDEEVRGEAITELVRRFSMVALGCAGLVVVTGGIGAWLHLGGLAALLESEYGRALLLKLGVVGVVFATGAYNYRRLGPAAGSALGARRLRRTSTFELAVTIVVLAVTAFLVALPTPRGEIGAGVELADGP